MLNSLVSFILTFIVSNSIFGQALDYSNLQIWAAHPQLENSVLKKYIEDSSYIHKADVFYIYPTLFLDRKDKRWNIEIDDSVQQWNVQNRALRFQGSAWAESGRMFVPYYRQANIRAYDSLGGKGREALLFAYQDIKAAFEHYLQFYNNGRPIILAGHSQGSTHISLLLKDYFEKSSLLNQLVVAYAPGIGIDTNQYEQIPLLKSPGATNGYVSWNTFKMRKKSVKYEKWYKGKSVINPITWNQDKVSHRKDHKGFLFWNNTIYTKAIKLKMIDGAVCISPPNFPYKFLAWKMEDYHLGDVNLFWLDIRENSKLRLDSFVKKM